MGVNVEKTAFEVNNKVAKKETRFHFIMWIKYLCIDRG